MANDKFSFDVFMQPFEKELSTLKSETIKRQIEVIESLVNDNESLGQEIREKIERGIKSEIFRIRLTLDNNKIARIAFLAFVYNDIGTLPSSLARKPFIDTFTKTCAQLNVSISDINLLGTFLVV